MKICTIYGTVSDKIKSVVFAKRLAQEAAEREARKKTVMIVCICAGIALVAAGIAVGIYFLSKKESVREKVNVIITNIKSKLPGKKTEEVCECDVEECECETTEAPETVEE
ncbi:MAG: hypothetical protein E7649_07210 [Ruminococcaceae bacterium]|nr:hypothetical protein [Oscillospiraceae bacterium]